MIDIILKVLSVVGILGGIGTVIGVLLALAAKAFHVEVDPRYEQLLKNLPGFNCGACGYAGCSGMADGLIKGGADINNCTPATEITRAKVKAILAGEDSEKV